MGDNRELVNLQNDLSLMKQKYEQSVGEGNRLKGKLEKSGEEAASLRRTLLELENLLNSSTHQIAGVCNW